MFRSKTASICQYQKSSGRLLVLLFFCIPVNLFSTENWFQGQGQMGGRKVEFTMLMQQAPVPIFLGSLRPAPKNIQEQTFAGIGEYLIAHYHAADTSFWLHRKAYYRASDSALLWQSTVRSGRSHHEWTRTFMRGDSLRLEFFTPIYGNGVHSYSPNTIPEEMLLWVAARIMRTGRDWSGEVLHASWEQSYMRGSRLVTGQLTTDRRIIDDVNLRVIRFTEPSGKSGEVWISPESGAVFRFSTFNGTWFTRFQ